MLQEVGNAVRNPNFFLAGYLEVVVYRAVFGGEGCIGLLVARLGKDINCQPVGQLLCIQRFIQAFRFNGFHPIPS
ncbi:hypothetical protein D3C75_1292180 [compost metagenome]